MADTHTKRSIRSAQPGAGDSRKTNLRKSTASRSTSTRRGKAAVRRRFSRPFYRFHDVKGKTMDFVEFYTSGGYHCLDVRFQDKTSLNFVIDPGFTLEAEHADWKTGNMRLLREWPAVRSAAL